MTSIAHSKATAIRPWMFQTRLRLFLTLFLILAVPTAILAVLTTIIVSQRILAEAVGQNTLAARLVAKHIDEEFFGLRRYVESFATRQRLVDSVADNDSDNIQALLAHLVTQNKKISRSVITDPQGALLRDYPSDPAVIGRNFSHRDWFQGASRTDGSYVSEIYERAALGGPAIVTVAMKIPDPRGQVLGYLGAQYAVEDLAEWLETVNPSHVHRIALLDQAGRQVLRVGSPARELISDHPAIREVLNQPEGALRATSLNGYKRALVSHVPIPELGWTVVAFTDERVVFDPVRRLLRAIGILFVVTLAIAGLLGWSWYRVLFAYAEDLQRSNQELESFCYSIAHNLRAPLRAMQGYTRAITEDYGKHLDETGKAYAARVIRAAARMDKLISDLLEYGDVVHRSLNFHQVNLDHCVRRAIRSVADKIERTGAQMKVDEPLGQVVADEKLLYEALQQILSNAIKYVARGVQPQVEISSNHGRDAVRLWIRDNGIGIKPGLRERIFEMFERLHGTESYSGTGIGLAIVRKAIERMGGRVGVEAKPEQGSAFWIELPKK